MKIHKNDTVQIMLGKDQGKSGKVVGVLPKAGKVLVEGLNLSKRHLSRSRFSEGGIIDISKPVNISNVALICSNCKKPTRVGYKVEGDTKIRICRKCKKAVA